MPSSGLSGPFNLTSIGVSTNVTKKSPGAYALGTVSADGTFNIAYVGRSDDDVAGRLQQHTPEAYTHFKFDYFPSAKAAFEKECRLYHDFKPRDNKVHPDRPKNANWSCPVCTIFD